MIQICCILYFDTSLLIRSASQGVLVLDQPGGANKGMTINLCDFVMSGNRATWLSNFQPINMKNRCKKISGEVLILKLHFIAVC